jgi:subfamily B ATP-binding cassette protein MsbA
MLTVVRELSSLGSDGPPPGVQRGGPWRRLPQPPPRAARPELRDLYIRHRLKFAGGLVLMLVGRAAGLMPPFASKQFIDRVAGRHEYELVWPLALGVAAATLIQAGTGFWLTRMLGVSAQRAITDIRRRLEAHVVRLPMRQFENTQVGVLASRIMSDAEGLSSLVGVGLVQMVGGLLTAAGALALLFMISWQMTLVLLVMLALFGACVYRAFTRLRPEFRERSRLAAEVMGRLSQTLSGIRIVKSYVAERREDLVFTRGVHRLFRNAVKTSLGWAILGTLVTVVVGAIATIMLLMGGRALASGDVTLGDLAMFVLYTGLVTAPLIQVAQVGNQLATAFAGLDRIDELLSMPTEDAEEAGKVAVPSLRGAIRCEGVAFEYVPGVPVLHDLTFDLPAGSMTALVGASGAGKTTLMSLIAAFHRPTSGRLLVDGHDITTFRLRDYRTQLGLVLQDNFLFDGTILDNIRFSRPDATMDVVRDVCRVAHCDEFIARLPDGYATMVGERGVKLSGGQRQRLAIARAILADPAILLLDEATSNLDSTSEQLVQSGLQTLRAGRTSLVIAHRLSTVRSAAQILVMEEGRIVERGTHDALLAAGGRYRAMHDRQHLFD